MPPFDAYPLLLTYGVRRYAFGARLIADRLGKEGLPGGVIAETWEVSDHDDEPAVVLNGAYRGRRLRQLVGAFPDEVVRPGWSGPHLPLLVKFLDASHRLPVHVHPDDAVARARYGAPNGKDEAWHVVWAAPGASVLAGVRPGVDRSALRAAFRAGAFDDVLLRYPVAPGDTVLVPGGVLHGFGPDTLIVEVQQTSDLSESVMPEDVYGRSLAPEAWDEGLERALDIATSDVRPRPEPGMVVASGALRRTVGCRGERFVLERWALSGAATVAPGEGGFATLTNLGDAVDLEYAGGVVTLPRAASCLLPAALGEIQLRPRGAGDLVVCYEPGLGAGSAPG
ncbi:MAG: type I phosphomannose isomerase catalytic subunit [Trueperaceae bacterium]